MAGQLVPEGRQCTKTVNVEGNRHQDLASPDTLSPQHTR